MRHLGEGNVDIYCLFQILKVGEVGNEDFGDDEMLNYIIRRENYLGGLRWIIDFQMSGVFRVEGHFEKDNLFTLNIHG